MGSVWLLLLFGGALLLALVYLAVWGPVGRGGSRWRGSPWRPARRSDSDPESKFPSEYSAGGGDQAGRSSRER